MALEEKFPALVEKMRREQEMYRIWLMEQPPEVILSRASEWSAREDMLSRLDEWDPDEKMVDALLSCDRPAETLFEWLRDDKAEDQIRAEIDQMADSIVQMMASGC